jgi:hypothetical protein
MQSWEVDPAQLKSQGVHLHCCKPHRKQLHRRRAIEKLSPGKTIAMSTIDAGSGTAATDLPPVLSKPINALMSLLVTVPD